MPPFPRSILVVRLGAIGDVTNALVFAGAVREHAPATRIGWAVHPLARPLVDGHPAIDRVHVWPRGAGWRGYRRLRAELRAERYELAVDLQRIAKSAWLARASGAPRVLGHDRGRTKELAWLWTNERIPRGDPREPMVEQYLSFACHLGVPDPVARHRLPPDEAADAWAAGVEAEHGAAPVCLAVGASKPENRWPAARFGRLAAILHAEAAVPVLLLGGPEDRSAGAEARRASEDAAVDLTGATDLRQLAALLGRARLVVAGDTGAIHLAAAQGRPVVALFGPADARRTGPWGAGHRVLREPPWDPAAPLVPARTEDLTVERVAAEVLEHLGQAPTTGPARVLP